MEKERPKVGVGVIIVRDGKILIGERLSSHGANTFSMPGGHLEFGESFEDCAKREATEECGLKDFVFKGLISVCNDVAYDKHYVTVSLLLESVSGEPYNAEPEKFKNWQWYDPKNLPDNLFISSEKAIKNWLNKTIYSD